jgi:predicted signal transduction protein with EAL and GGDEF domain
MRLEIEITETVMLQNTAATLETLNQLQSLGVRIAMDDFGTGYSSLSYLRRFPFNKIKIDQCFIRDMSEEHESMAVLRAITGLGTNLGMTTTAEGWKHSTNSVGGNTRPTLSPAVRGMHGGPGLLLQQAEAGRRGREYARRHCPPDGAAARGATQGGVIQMVGRSASLVLRSLLSESGNLSVRSTSQSPRLRFQPSVDLPAVPGDATIQPDRRYQ